MARTLTRWPREAEKEIACIVLCVYYVCTTQQGMRDGWRKSEV